MNNGRVKYQNDPLNIVSCRAVNTAGPAHEISKCCRIIEMKNNRNKYEQNLLNIVGGCNVVTMVGRTNERFLPFFVADITVKS